MSRCLALSPALTDCSDRALALVWSAPRYAALRRYASIAPHGFSPCRVIPCSAMPRNAFATLCYATLCFAS